MNDKRIFNMIRRILFLCAAWLGACGLMSSCSCGGNKSQGEAIKVNYETKVLQKENRIYNMSFPATTSGVIEVKAYPQVEGIITQKNFVAGTIVTKGQALFVIDPTEYQLSVQSAEADLKVAKASMASTKLQYESNLELYRKNVISEFVLNTSLNDYNSAEASVAQAEAQLNIARTNLRHCTISAPATGYVADNGNYKVGDMASRSQYLCTVSDISKILADFSITETDLLDIVQEFHLRNGKKGMEGPKGGLVGDSMPKVKLRLKDGSIHPQEGRITVISSIVNPTTGTAACRAEFDNPDGVLRSGLSANVIIPITLENILCVPQTAAVRLQDKMMFYRIKEDGTVEGILCQTYPSNDGKEYYILDGLNEGDEVVTNGVGKLTNGAKIR